MRLSARQPPSGTEASVPQPSAARRTPLHSSALRLSAYPPIRLSAHPDFRLSAYPAFRFSDPPVLCPFGPPAPADQACPILGPPSDAGCGLGISILPTFVS